MKHSRKTRKFFSTSGLKKDRRAAQAMLLLDEAFDLLDRLFDDRDGPFLADDLSDDYLSMTAEKARLELQFTVKELQREVQRMQRKDSEG